jgi:hypothetical protein
MTAYPGGASDTGPLRRRSWGVVHRMHTHTCAVTAEYDSINQTTAALFRSSLLSHEVQHDD